MPGVQTPKQYRLINGQAMIVWAVRALLADMRVDSVVVGVQADDPFAQACLRELDRVRIVASGGASRAKSPA